MSTLICSCLFIIYCYAPVMYYYILLCTIIYYYILLYTIIYYYILRLHSCVVLTYSLHILLVYYLYTISIVPLCCHQYILTYCILCILLMHDCDYKSTLVSYLYTPYIPNHILPIYHCTGGGLGRLDHTQASWIFRGIDPFYSNLNGKMMVTY